MPVNPLRVQSLGFLADSGIQPFAYYTENGVSDAHFKGVVLYYETFCWPHAEASQLPASLALNVYLLVQCIENSLLGLHIETEYQSYHCVALRSVVQGEASLPCTVGDLPVYCPRTYCPSLSLGTYPSISHD